MGLAKAGSFLQSHKQLSLGLRFLVVSKQTGQVKVGLGGIFRFQLQQGAPRLDRGFSLILGLGGQSKLTVGSRQERIHRKSSLGVPLHGFPVPRLFPRRSKTCPPGTRLLVL